MFWFYHEYLDEIGRFCISRVEARTEQDARKMHSQACHFDWVTNHREPSVSALMGRGEAGVRTLAPAHRPNDRYHTEYSWVPMPDYIRDLMRNVRAGRETTLPRVWSSFGGEPMPDAQDTVRAAAEPDGFVTPF
jgi:hypothetical protein